MKGANVTYDFVHAPMQTMVRRIWRESPAFHRKILELLFVLDGEATIVKNGKRRDLATGDCIAIDAGHLHEIHSNHGCLVVSLHIDIDYFTKDMPYIHGISFDIGTNIDEDNTIIKKILWNYMLRLLIIKNIELPRHKEISTYIAEIIVRLMTKYFVNDEYMKYSITNMDPQHVNRMFNIASYISKNYSKKELSISDIAINANISNSRTTHFWREHTKTSVQTALMLHRLGETARLLLETDFSINEISERCGFSDGKYLYRKFKDIYGMTPNEYRKCFTEASQVPSQFMEYSETEQKQVIETYGVHFFSNIRDFSFWDFGDLMELEDLPTVERNLFGLYKHTLRGSTTKLREIIKTQKHGIFSLTPGKGIIIYKNTPEVHWEYLYNVVTWYARLDMQIRALLDYSYVEEERWTQIVTSIYQEVRWNWGNDIVSKLSFVVMVENPDLYDDACSWKERVCSKLQKCSMDILLSM